VSFLEKDEGDRNTKETQGRRPCGDEDWEQ
jgi:hypothetical protein